MLPNSKNNMTLSYLPAKVIHSNKYNQINMLYSIRFLFANLFHDVVFKTDTGEEYPMTLKNLNLPIYQGQSVILIIINNSVIGFIDNSTNNYFYLTRNLQERLGKGQKLNWIIFVGIVLLVSAILLVKDFNSKFFIYLFLIPVAYWCYLRISNSFFERKIDKLISDA